MLAAAQAFLASLRRADAAGAPLLAFADDPDGLGAALSATPEALGAALETAVDARHGAPVMLHGECFASAGLDRAGRVVVASTAFGAWFDTADVAAAVHDGGAGEPRVVFADDRSGRLVALAAARHATARHWPLDDVVCAALDQRSATHAVIAFRPGARSSTQAAATYGLTQAEAALITALARTGDLQAAAQLRGVAYETARKFVAAAMRTTGTRRQTDLIRRTLSLAAGDVPRSDALERLLRDLFGLTERQARLALHIADPLAMTVTDPVLLERVLRNLLANAVACTQRGGVLLACRPRTAPDGERHLRIEIWDSGVGIAPAEQGRVFEEFYQAPARTADCPSSAHSPKRPGQGLGLSIVQRLVRLLQLRVLLHSQPGRGSVFFVEGLAPAGVAPQAAAAARLQMRRLAGLRVAVLEDDAEVRDAMRRLLQLWDCRVVDAADGAGLLQRMPGPLQAPHALVADLRLAGGRSGADDVRGLHAAWGRAVPVLWISGETAADGLRATLPAGATVLSKPFSPTRLRAWLEQQLPEPAAAASAPPS